MFLMESLSMVVSSCPLKTQKPCSSKPISTCHFLASHKPHFPTNKTLLQNHPLLLQTSHLAPLFQNLTKTQLSLTLINLLTPLPCFASEPVVSDKINLESVLLAIDDFFNRNPFFVAGCTFIWLVVIPLTDEFFLRKYRFISAIDAFRKLRDDPNVQLLDIRDNKTVKYLRSPNLKILNKGVVQVQYSEGDEDGFVKKVLQSFGDVSSTVVCVLDNFDGNSIKVAELLFKNGFKEAYAIRGGVRGDKGWLILGKVEKLLDPPGELLTWSSQPMTTPSMQMCELGRTTSAILLVDLIISRKSASLTLSLAIQDSLLPPSVHIYPKKKVKTSQQLRMKGVIQQTKDENGSASSANIPIEDKWINDGHLNKTTESQ